MRRTDGGVALVVVLMAMLLMTALGTALVMTTSAETMIAANYRSAQQGAYAADAGLRRALVDLQPLRDWTPVLSGASRSTFTDAPPIDLNLVLNLANCAKTTACSSADMDRVTADRPWGAGNPRWQLYAYGKLANLWPPGAQTPAGVIDSPFSVVVLVADAGDGFLALRAEAFGPRGAHRRVDATVVRDALTARLRMLSWRQIR
jgi:PilX N-terminal